MNPGLQKKFFLFLLSNAMLTASAQQIFQMPKHAESRVSSFENPNGAKGNGGKTNKTAKGNAFETITEGQTKTLLDINGQGIIQRKTILQNRADKWRRVRTQRTKFPG